MFAPMKVTATFTGGESPDEVPPGSARDSQCGRAEGERCAAGSQ